MLLKKLICLTCYLYTDKCSSVNYHLLLLIKSVLMGRGYDVAVYSYEPEPVYTEQEMLDNLGCGEFSGRVEFRRLNTMSPGVWASRLSEADVILCQHYSFAEILLTAKAQKTDIKIVSWIHSIVQEEYLSGSINGKNDAYPILCQQKQQAALSDVCVFDSQYDYNLGRLDFTQMKRTAVIYPVSEMEKFREERLEAERKIFQEGMLKLSDVEILFIGRWDFRKGLDSLIPCSFRMFLEHGVKTVLLTNGNEEYVFSDQAGKRQFRTLVDSGGLQFESWKPEKKEYARYLCEKRRVAVLPSYYDAFNMAAYDCAVLGIPLIVSNRCGVCELLVPHESLAVCNPYDTEVLYEQIYAMCTAALVPLPGHILHYGPTEFHRDITDLFYELL